MEAYRQITLKLSYEKLKPAIFLKLSVQSDTSMYIVYLKAYVNHLPGVQVMATISLQGNLCSDPSDFNSNIRKKCVMKIKESRSIRNKRRARKIVFDGRGEFIRRLWKGHLMDINEPRVNDS